MTFYLNSSINATKYFKFSNFKFQMIENSKICQLSDLTLMVKLKTEKYTNISNLKDLKLISLFIFEILRFPNYHYKILTYISKSPVH